MDPANAPLVAHFGLASLFHKTGDFGRGVMRDSLAIFGTFSPKGVEKLIRIASKILEKEVAYDCECTRHRVSSGETRSKQD